MERTGGFGWIATADRWLAVAVAAFSMLLPGATGYADPVCLVSRGTTLYRFNGGGTGGVESFPNQAGEIVGMTLVPPGVAVAGCVAGDALAVGAGDGGKFWRVDNAACGTPSLAEVGQLPGSHNVTSVAFANGKLYGIGGGGFLREFNPVTFELVAPGIDVAPGDTDIGGLTFDGESTWYATDSASSSLYRFDELPAPLSWELVGPAGIEFNKNGLEMHDGQLWGALRSPGSPAHLYVGRFDAGTGAFTPTWAISPALSASVAIVVPSGAPGVRGDVNCDGSADGLDVAAFVLALTDPSLFAAQYPDCGILAADLSGDCQVNGDDIQGFVDQLLG